ncbi:MAG: GNAT family N-acetyltransferase [Parvularcula sp.]|nr:GNAT family N-acetyltransferase [Parvularcula sp.]
MTDLVAPGAEALRTERLILRRFRLADVPAYQEMMSQPSVERTLIPGPSNLDEAGRQIAMIEGFWALRGFSFFAVEEKTTGLLVGRVGPWEPVGWPGFEIGWTIHPRRQGRGYAAEAAFASALWAFAHFPEQPSLIHVIAASNTASQRVAAKIGAARNGETFTHPLVGPLEVWETKRDALVRRSPLAQASPV